MIRCALKLSAKKSPTVNPKAIVYVSIAFDMQLKTELLASMPNIRFEHVPNDVIREDMIDVSQLEQMIKRDLKDQQSYPFMVIAHAGLFRLKIKYSGSKCSCLGTTLLGRCDELTRINQLCQEHHLWLHVIGDLVGCLGLLSTIQDNVHINCDSLTMDAVKLFGIQNLPYLTFFLRTFPKMKRESQTDINSIEHERSNVDNQSTTNTNISSSSSSTNTTLDTNNISNPPPLSDLILHNSSIGFLSIWSISQRCSKSNVLYHMKCSFDLANLLTKRLAQIKTMRILNDDSYHQPSHLTYKRICSGDAPDEQLPKTIVLFRFETLNVPEVSSLELFHSSLIDLFRLINWMMSMVILIYSIFGYLIKSLKHIRK